MNGMVKLIHEYSKVKPIAFSSTKLEVTQYTWTADLRDLKQPGVLAG